MDEITIRDATAGDKPFLLRVLLLAINWNPSRPAADERVVRARPDLRHYLDGWPLDGDVGVVAEGGGEPVGAAWLRSLPANDPGYGFVAPDVPELTIGVIPAWRGRGVGGRLLEALAARATERRIVRISLSVERANRAARLYRTHGFREVGATEGALTMVRDLEP